MMWFYMDGDREVGPISTADMQQLINTKQITGKTLARKQDMDRWHPLAELTKAKKPDSQAPPPADNPPSANEAPPPAPPVSEPPSPAPAAVSTTPQRAVPDNIPFQFKGTGGEYFKIWIVNVLLSILTLGIYSAWAKVRRKQYFYGNTQVAGAGFRYLADPVKILKGRLIVFVFFILYSTAGEFIPVLGGIMMLAFLIFLPWLVVRSLAFNARNSSLRNIRFNFTGTYGQAAKAYLLFPILSVLTLGILLPYAFFRQKQFVVENSSYGTTPFRFHATAKDYYRIVGLFILHALIFIVAAVVVSLLFAPLSALIIMVLYLYAMAYFSVKTTNLLYSSGTLADHRFSANLGIKDYALIILTNSLATVATLGLFYPFAVVRALQYKIDHLSLLPGSDLDRFVAAEIKETSALGEEMSDFMDFDFGL
ncbi:DUF898 family protein [Desulfosudis oleivorans]|uniref:GYF domain-containing protein n=1 Tax=Desulfosudis oleivorans (strain DSM 6200 / JCM 39069 / Hxd3) TaxID=96561 RepID=A8ZXJ6_DESOH|nr:DUF898 family protein [Desulfosudis oleivorans]ABW66954.1 protein of unknown function DUF898 transmembrane [Desulfosudis oleivorans Hxd3]